MSDEIKWEKPLKGEVIEDILYHHDDEWFMLKMKSGRVFKADSCAYYGGESSISLNEVRPELWDERQNK